MGRRRRGRERLERCGSCGRGVPRAKAVSFSRRSVYSTDLKGKDAENVTATIDREMYYCISCAKHRGIFEKLKQRLARQRERAYLR